jgi:hypothetical protein
MLNQARSIGRLLGAMVLFACVVACDGERGGLDAEVYGATDANISMQRITSAKVNGYAGYGETSNLSPQDATTADLEENPHCILFQLTVCGRDFEERSYTTVEDWIVHTDPCNEATAWISIEESGPDCRGEPRRWTSSAGSISIESVEDDEVHVSFDVSMQPLSQIVVNTATGTFSVKGTIWTDEIDGLD